MGPGLRGADLPHYLDLIGQARGPAPGVQIWPETSFPGLLDADEPARQAIARVTGGTPALIGGIRFDADRRPRNSLFALQSDGGIGAVYDKWHLVPVGEYIPSWLPLPLMVMPGQGFASGPGPRTLQCSRPAAVRRAHQLRGDLPRRHRRSPRPAGLAGQRHQRCLVRQFDRPRDSTWRQHGCVRWRRACRCCAPPTRGFPAAFDARGHELGRSACRRRGFWRWALPACAAGDAVCPFWPLVPAIAGLVALGAGLMARRVASVRLIRLALIRSIGWTRV